MKIFSADQFELPLPEGHRFPREKYTLLRERVQAASWKASKTLLVPEAAQYEQLLRVHHQDYLDRVIQGELTEREIRRIGFPWSPELVERSRRSVGGTIYACRAAVQDGIAVHLAGGTHHAYPDHGEGFCVFNDCAVAARDLQIMSGVERVIILDCDVHQGNGTAATFSEDPSVFTFSIHAEKNFPFHKEPSDLDIGLPDLTGDEAYLDALSNGLESTLERAGADFAIYLAGADPYAEDSLGRLSLSKAGLAERDRLVMDQCWSAGMPLAVVMSGGYAKDIADSVEIHFQTVQIAMEYETR